MVAGGAVTADVIADRAVPRSTPRDGAVGIAAVRTPAPATPQRSCWSTMENYAALVTERAPLRALPLPLIRTDPHTVADRISQLPSRVGAVFLIGLDPSGAAQVQRHIAAVGGPPVISELDAVTAVLAAATANVLRHRADTTRPGRAAVTGAETVPRLGALLADLGVGMTPWHRNNAESAVRQAVGPSIDVLIDLTGAAARPGGPGRTLTIPSDPYDFAALVVPGLLNSLCGRERTPIDNRMLTACARALTLVTTEDQILPEITERLLVPAITRQVRRILNDP